MNESARCGVKVGKHDGCGCILDPGHDGLHSNGRQTWSDRKPAAKKAPAKKKGRKS